jgi:hypothetical protein
MKTYLKYRGLWAKKMKNGNWFFLGLQERIGPSEGFATVAETRAAVDVATESGALR